ncbi:TRAP transporter substrate-binding protein [Methylobacterium nigriterrae]|uniref:TRAP transporter substrate-binding protein n=1 Tax=Methylobacterium nigriterrae TaxID=3127512 RepID=UPI003013CE9F
MDRRQFLRGCGAAVSSVGLLARPANASTRAKVFRLGVTNGNLSQMGSGAVSFAERVTALSAGRMRVDVYPCGTLGGEAETTQDAAKGALELVVTSSAGYERFAPKLSVFDIPFLFRDVAHARAVLDGPIGQAALASFDNTGLVGLAWCENGLRHLTTTTVPVTTPRDLAGLKVRVPQSEAMLAGFKALGADAQPLPFPELFGALSAGEFQGQENPLANIMGGGFYRVQKYLSLTGHVYSTGILLMSRRASDALTEDERAVFSAAARAAGPASREAGDRTANDNIAELKRRGMTVLSEIDRAAFIAASQPALKQFEAKFGKATLDAIRSYGT